MTQAFELPAISLPVKVNRFTKVADVAGTDDAAMLSNRQRDVGLESRDQALDLCHGWFLPYSDACFVQTADLLRNVPTATAQASVLLADRAHDARGRAAVAHG